MSEAAIEQHDPGQADRRLGLIRIASVPVIFAGERLVAHPTLESDPFDYILAAAAVYSVVALIVVYSRYRTALPGVLYAALDLAFICSLAYASGGAFSQLRYAFFLLPVGAAFLLAPSETAAVSVVSVACYVAISLTHPATVKGRDLEFVLVQAVYLCWMALAESSWRGSSRSGPGGSPNSPPTASASSRRPSRPRTASAGASPRLSTTRRSRTS